MRYVSDNKGGRGVRRKSRISLYFPLDTGKLDGRGKGRIEGEYDREILLIIQEFCKNSEKYTTSSYKDTCFWGS